MKIALVGCTQSPPSTGETTMIFINHQRSSKAAKDYYTQHIALGDGRYYVSDRLKEFLL